MINLIKNEFIKIIHKKNIYIFLFLFLIFSIFTNYLDYTNNDKITYYQSMEYELTKEYDYYSEELENRQLNDYVHLESMLATTKLKLDLNTYYNDPRVDYIDTIVYDLYQLYYNDLLLDEPIDDIRNEIDNQINILTNNEKEFYTILISNLVKSIEETDCNGDFYCERDILVSEKKLDYYNLSIEHDIKYSDTYFYSQVASTLINYQLMIESNEESNEYEDLKIYFLNSDYNLENNINTNIVTIQNKVANFYKIYIQFIILFIVLISSNILSSELNKGTIKTLLITPHSRTKILISKFITILLLIPALLIITSLIEFITAGIFLGFSELSNSVIVYNYNKESMIELSILNYHLNQSLALIPLMLIISVITIFITVLIPSSSFAGLCGFFIIIIGEVVNSAFNYYDLSVLKYLITAHWDLSMYLYGGTNPYIESTLLFSIFVYVVYLISIIITSAYLFKKKNIKNM